MRGSAMSCMTITVGDTLNAVPAALDGLHAELAGPNRLTISYQPSRTSAGQIIQAVNAAGLTIADLSTEETDLEDIFLQLTRTDPGAGA